MELIWTTKDGRCIPIKDMTNSHLLNTIKFLTKKINNYPGYQCYMGDSVYAEDAVERDNEINEEHRKECFLMCDEMKKEARTRRIHLGE